MSSFETAAMLLSLQVALLTVLVTTPIAVVLALWMARTQWRGKFLLDAVILLPIALPPAVIGFALLMGLGQDGPLGQWLHDTTGFSLNFFPAGAVLAASCMTVRTLGASRLKAFLTITLPLVWPAVASAMALGLAAAWGESGATLVLAATLQPHQTADITAPVAMVQSLLSGARGEGSAWHLALVSLGVAMLAVVVSEWGRQRWRRRWQARLKPVGQA